MQFSRSDIEKGVKLINDFQETSYPCATDEDEYVIRKDTAVLFGRLAELYGESPGTFCIMADMAYGSLKDMAGAASDVARDYLLELIDNTGISPQDLTKEQMAEGELNVYGKTGTYIY